MYNKNRFETAGKIKENSQILTNIDFRLHLHLTRTQKKYVENLFSFFLEMTRLSYKIENPHETRTSISNETVFSKYRVVNNEFLKEQNYLNNYYLSIAPRG